MRVLTVQDISCFGQCSTTVALPVLSAFGIETAILPSAILSTHTTSFKNYTFLDLTEEMPKIVSHWKEEKMSFDGLLTGYIGDARQFDIIRDVRQNLVKQNSLFIMDPAMADDGQLYPGLGMDTVGGMRSLVKIADVILPNITEGYLLTGLDKDKADIYTVAKALADMGPETVIITGFSPQEDKIGALCYTKNDNSFYQYTTDKNARSSPGTGDVFASVCAAYLFNGKDVKERVKASCEFVSQCLDITRNDKSHFYGVKFEEVLKKKNTAFDK